MKLSIRKANNDHKPLPQFSQSGLSINFDDAEAWFQHFIDEINFETEDALIQEANRLSEAKRYDDALEIYNNQLRFVEYEQLAFSMFID